MRVISLPLFFRKYHAADSGKFLWYMTNRVLLFVQIATAKSLCDFTAFMCLWGCIVETNRIFEYKEQ